MYEPIESLIEFRAPGVARQRNCAVVGQRPHHQVALWHRGSGGIYGEMTIL
jgi:hypothetical protein